MLELLIGLSVMSGVSFYTMKMAEKVEGAVVIYQDSVQDMKAIKEKLKLARQEASELEEYDSLESVILGLDEALYFEE